MKLDWGKSLLIFFIIFLSLVATFIVFAFRQSNDLETKDYYEKGADYFTEIKVQRRSAIYNDSISFLVSENAYAIHIATTLATSVSNFDVHFYRPSNEELDIKLSMDSDTLLHIDKNLLAHGRYKMYITWHLNNENYKVLKDLMIK